VLFSLLSFFSFTWLFDDCIQCNTLIIAFVAYSDIFHSSIHPSITHQKRILRSSLSISMLHWSRREILHFQSQVFECFGDDHRELRMIVIFVCSDKWNKSKIYRPQSPWRIVLPVQFGEVYREWILRNDQKEEIFTKLRHLVYEKCSIVTEFHVLKSNVCQ
jgi:hypothetical protein